MNRKEYEDWCNRTGHITCNDWNYQTIRGFDHFFILNPRTDTFSLIRFDTENCDYKVLVSDWTDYNGYAEQFHKETNNFWKNK